MPTNKQGVILPLYSALVRSHLESGPVFPGGVNILEEGPKKGHKEDERTEAAHIRGKTEEAGPGEETLRKDLCSLSESVYAH